MPIKDWLIAEAFLKTPTTGLPGVGTKVAAKLERLSIKCFQDILWHLPKSYENRTEISAITDTTKQHLATTPEKILTQGQITSIQKKKRNNKTVCTIELETEHLPIQLNFFYQPHFLNHLDTANKPWIRCFGQLGLYNQQLQMTHPEIEAIESPCAPLCEYLTPIYPSTEGISQSRLRYWGTWLLEKINSSRIQLDLLPNDCLQAYGLPSLTEALNQIHAKMPAAKQHDHAWMRSVATYRIMLDPWLAQTLYWKSNRYQASLLPSSDQVDRHDNQALTRQFIDELPFELTQDQLIAWQEIQADLNQTYPMFRLLQGEVGSGKTLVALLATIQTYHCNGQTAIMAPTEVLARQHLETCNQLLSPLNIKAHLLIGKMKQIEKNNLYQALASGKIKIIIGTHALFQEKISFNRLQLVIIDEQHRFGVEQRTQLLKKQTKGTPHQLFMSATPIPRTLAMSLYDYLDTSTIKQLPSDRKAIKTAVIPQSKRPLLFQRIKDITNNGQQLYWICPYIETDDAQATESITSLCDEIKHELPEIKVGTLHGKMNTDEKAQQIKAFQNNEISILIATSIIEVGINIPNATLIIIENAERWGLSQLHQLRGRVGRGPLQSYCILVYKDQITELGKKRLSAIRNTNCGFKIAEIDLSLRGPGNFLGEQQSGGQHLSQTISHFQPVIDMSAKVAKQLLHHDSNQTSHPQTENKGSQSTRVKALVKRWAINHQARS